jgi:hypothetical protein
MTSPIGEDQASEEQGGEGLVLRLRGRHRLIGIHPQGRAAIADGRDTAALVGESIKVNSSLTIKRIPTCPKA